MQEHEKTLLSLVVVGALIALANMLNGSEPITARLLFARVVLGTGVAVAAGAALLWVPDLPQLAIIGLGAAFGIAGHTWFESWLRKKGSSLLKGKKK
ncbi:holin [Salmonella enterica]|nr:holin [Salmonella enterica]EBP5663791.1 holin [Salmonella enterica]